MQLLEEYKDQIKEIKRIDNSSQNIFKILRQETMENKHSIFLSWLLNPLASHGFKEKFAQLFFDKAFENKDPIPDAGKIERIILEQRINGEEQRKEGKDRRRIDILIIGEDFTCTIENKYGSEAHGGQCEDYKKYVIGEYGERKANNRFIFLDIDKPKDFDYMHKSRYAEFDFISYECIKNILGDLLSAEIEGRTENRITRCYIEQYKEVLDEKYGYTEYDEYKKIIDKIDFGKIVELSQIEDAEYEALDSDQKRFIDEIKRYYRIKKKEYDESILDNLKAISKNEYYIKSDYGKKKSEGGAGYAHAIPVSIEGIDIAEYALCNKMISEEEYIQYNKNNEKNKALETKIKGIKCTEKKNRNDGGEDSLPFKTIDFRAPMDEYKDISIAIHGGFIPKHSKNLCSKLKKNSLNKFDELTTENKGWHVLYKFFVRSGAGSILKEFELDREKIKNIEKIFDSKYVGNQNNISDVFCQDFLSYLKEINTCLNTDKEKINVLEFFNNMLEKNKEGVEESKKYIDMLLEEEYCRNQFDKYRKEKISGEEIFADNKSLQDNYEVEIFKEWMKTELKESEKKYKNKKSINVQLYNKIESILNSLEDEYRKNITKNLKKNDVWQSIMKLIDQRQNKIVIISCTILLVYEIQDEDKKNLKQVFYEKGLEGAEVFGLKERFDKYILKNPAD